MLIHREEILAIMNCSGTGYRPTENMPLGVKLPCVAATANGVVRINRFAS